MEKERLGFGARLWLALVLPWKVLFDAVLAHRAERLLSAEEPAPEAPEEIAAPEVPAAPAAPDPAPALQLLAILQREGRFIDFLQEDVSGFADADIGAAARVVHEGCRKALQEYVKLEPVRGEAEGDAVVLEPGFDPAQVRLTGNVVGEPPFRGRLAHHGWRAAEVRLPAPADGYDPRIVAPAEVEL